MIKIKELKTEKSVSLNESYKTKVFICNRDVTKKQLKLHLGLLTTDVIKKINKLNFTIRKKVKGNYSSQKLAKFYVYIV